MEDVCGQHGMVVTRHPTSAEAGLEMLREGGNAIDAAVAAAATECAIAPADNGFGGYGGSMMIYLAGEKRNVAIDYNTRAPAAADEHYFLPALEHLHGHIGQAVKKLGWSGYRLMGVPGTVAGLRLALERFGTKTWAEIMQPAIEAVADGVEANTTFHRAVRSGLEAIKSSAEAQDNLLVNGWPPEPGEHAPMASFRRFLERLADEGPESFYRGPMAQTIVRHVQEQGGIMATEDMAEYHAREVNPLKTIYRGHDVFTTPLANGGATVLQILNLLGGFDVASLRTQPAEYADLLVRLYRLAWRDRLTLLGDPAQTNVDVDRILSKAYAGELRAKLPHRQWEDGSNSTIHLSTADAHGNMVALTQTMGGGMPGSLNFVPELGLIMNHGMVLFDPRPGTANGVGPGKQPLNNMCPILVFRKGEPLYTLGSPGARRIISALTQIIVNLIDFGMGVTAALAHPRLHCEDAGSILLEKDVPEDARDQLSKAGHQLETADKVAGPAHAIRIDVETGRLIGGTDPRGRGKAATY